MKLGFEVFKTIWKKSNKIGHMLVRYIRWKPVRPTVDNLQNLVNVTDSFFTGQRKVVAITMLYIWHMAYIDKKSNKTGSSWKRKETIDYLATVCKISRTSAASPSEHCVQQEADWNRNKQIDFNVNKITYFIINIQYLWQDNGSFQVDMFIITTFYSTSVSQSESYFK